MTATGEEHTEEMPKVARLARALAGAGGWPELKETQEARCKDCGNRRDDGFCLWLHAFLKSGVADDPDCEGYVCEESSVQQKRGRDKSVGSEEVSRAPRPKTDSASALKQPEKTMILTALELKNLKGSIIWQKVPCGKSNCRCSHGSLHGPYAYLRYFQDGKGRKKYLGKSLAFLVSKTRKELEAQLEEILGQSSGRL